MSVVVLSVVLQKHIVAESSKLKAVLLCLAIWVLPIITGTEQAVSSPLQ
jgi:hypothetical protein